MRVRSDFTLKLMIEKTINLGGSEHVRAVLADVLTHMGERSPYKGGQELISLLRYAESAARNEGDLESSERIEDALAYAMNTMLRPDLEMKYQIFAGSREAHLNLVRSTVAMVAKFGLEVADEFAKENPEASIEDLRKRFQRLNESFEVQEDHRHPGNYRLTRGTRENATWLAEMLLNRLDRKSAEDLDAASVHAKKLSAEQMTLADLARAAQLKLRSESLRALSSAVNNPHSLEQDLQRELERNLWIFGGTYLPRIAQRRLVPGSELDIPLLRPDGTMHVVELKRANLKITTHQRGKLILSSEVHRAVGQVMNYLVELDEDRTRILNASGVDVRRAGATVLIGHPTFEPGVKETEMNAILRTYNSHLARVTAMTYKQLLDGAGRALGFSEESAVLNGVS